MITIGGQEETSAADVPYYVTDNEEVTRWTGWAPQRGLNALLDDVVSWLKDHRTLLEPILSAPAPGSPRAASSIS
jgi:CDP-paratose 2-epimerase